jgi:hypothetical protein
MSQGNPDPADGPGNGGEAMTQLADGRGALIYGLCDACQARSDADQHRSGGVSPRARETGLGGIEVAVQRERR